MSRTVSIADDVAAALGPEQAARLTGPRGRAGVKAAVRGGLLVGGVVPVKLRGPGDDTPRSVYR
ncbi:hypothetical protein [Amycolatopsis thailandensis]|uniref:hypothetical protein n=1 Tax=Amycolatopsis thailandensis TaxID=589330 RepID=UPI00362753A8